MSDDDILSSLLGEFEGSDATAPLSETPAVDTNGSDDDILNALLHEQLVEPATTTATQQRGVAPGLPPPERQSTSLAPPPAYTPRENDAPPPYSAVVAAETETQSLPVVAALVSAPPPAAASPATSRSITIAERIAAAKARARRIAAERIAAAQRTNGGSVASSCAVAERVDTQPVSTEKSEAERLAAEKAEAERVAAEKAEAARIAAEKAEAERLAAEKAEAERIAFEKAEAERLAAEKAEAERVAAEKAEAARIAAEKAEAERLATEKAEAERIAFEKMEADRVAAEKAEAVRLSAAEAEAERIAAETAEAEHLAAEEAEVERLAAEQAEAERLAAEKAEAERLAAEKAAAERVAFEEAEAERTAFERAEAERLAVEKAEADRLAAEDAQAQRHTAARVPALRTTAGSIPAEHGGAEPVAVEKIEIERITGTASVDDDYTVKSSRNMDSSLPAPAVPPPLYSDGSVDLPPPPAYDAVLHSNPQSPDTRSFDPQHAVDSEPFLDAPPAYEGQNMPSSAPDPPAYSVIDRSSQPTSPTLLSPNASATTPAPAPAPAPASTELSEKERQAALAEAELMRELLGAGDVTGGDEGIQPEILAFGDALEGKAQTSLAGVPSDTSGAHSSQIAAPSTPDDSHLVLKATIVNLEEKIAIAHINRDEASYLALLQAYRMALVDNIALPTDTVRNISWILRNFSDYLVQEEHVSPSHARPSPHTSSDTPNLGRLRGRDLAAFLHDCGIDNSIAAKVALEECIEGGDIVNFTIDDFSTLGINITDPKLASLRDAIISFWEQQGGGWRRQAQSSSSNNPIAVGTRVAVKDASNDGNRVGTVTSIAKSEDGLSFVEVVFDDSGDLEKVLWDNVVDLTITNDGSGQMEDGNDGKATSGASSAQNGNWVKYFDDASGQDYWYNTETGLSQWHEPATAESLGLDPRPPETIDSIATDTARNEQLLARGVNEPATEEQERERREVEQERERPEVVTAEVIGAEVIDNSAGEANDLVSQLMEMGFARGECVRALHACGGDLNRAAAFLLEGGDDASAEIAAEVAAAADRQEREAAGAAVNAGSSSRVEGGVASSAAQQSRAEPGDVPLGRPQHHSAPKRQSRGLLARARELSALGPAEMYDSDQSVLSGRAHQHEQPDAFGNSPHDTDFFNLDNSTMDEIVSRTPRVKFDLTGYVIEAEQEMVASSTVLVQVDLIVRPYASEFGDDPGNSRAPRGCLCLRSACYVCVETDISHGLFCCSSRHGLN